MVLEVPLMYGTVVIVTVVGLGRVVQSWVKITQGLCEI